MAGRFSTASVGSASCATSPFTPTSTASIRPSPAASNVASVWSGARAAGSTRAAWSTFLAGRSWSTPWHRCPPSTVTCCAGRRPRWSTISTAEASVGGEPRIGLSRHQEPGRPAPSGPLWVRRLGARGCPFCLLHRGGDRRGSIRPLSAASPQEVRPPVSTASSKAASTRLKQNRPEPGATPPGADGFRHGGERNSAGGVGRRRCSRYL